MKKYRLLAAEEWGTDKIETPLDQSIYNILTEVLPEHEKLEKYSDIIGEFSASIKSEGESNTTEPSLPISVSSTHEVGKVISSEKTQEGEGKPILSNLQGQGNIGEENEKAVAPLSSEGYPPQEEDITTVADISPPLEVENKGVKPPGIQTRDWRQIWISLKKH